MRLAFNGFGKVSKALLSHLIKFGPADLEVSYLSRSDRYLLVPKGKPLKAFDAEQFSWTMGKPLSAEEIMAEAQPDVYFELTPTDLTKSAEIHARLLNFLNGGVSVISANKAPILYDYLGLKTAAQETRSRIGLSAVMGASLPSFAVGKYGTLGSEIHKMEGILNGTSNFILSFMEDGLSFEQALELARKNGIAEPNWAYDVDGIDSAVKMTIIATVILDKNIPLDLAKVSGIRSITERSFREVLKAGKRYKLVARFENENVSVSPELVSPDDVFYLVKGAEKALKIHTNTLSDMIVLGGKSGLVEVSASMLRDLLWIRQHDA